MQPHRKISVCFLLAVLLITAGCTSRQLTRDHIFQYSSTTIARAMDNAGGIRPNEIHRSTNFGFGSLSDERGLLIQDGAETFKVTQGGTVTGARHGTTVSYALLTKFDTDTSIPTITPRSRETFQRLLDRTLKSRNLFYAIQVRGEFEFVELANGLDSNQPTRKHRGRTGILIGFRLPDFEASIRESGYRFVFLNRNRTLGGVAENFKITEGTVTVDQSEEFTLSLPRTRQFYDLKLP